MNRHIIRSFTLATIAGLFAATAVAQTPEQIEKIKAAVPGKAYADAKKPRRLLVFSATRGFRHGSIPAGIEAMKALAANTGAFDVVASEDIAVFEPDSLKQFDAVCMLNTTGELFTPPNLAAMPDAERDAAMETEKRLKKSLSDFIASGKGVVGIHAATDCFYKWPEFGNTIGGYFDGHPWHEKVSINVEKREHPLCCMFESDRFEIVDEIYQLRDPYSRKRQTVLLSLDTERTNMDKKGIKRTDGDFAVSWARREGKGRIFYCSLGHRDEIYWNPLVLRHYLAGIQFALGDLDWVGPDSAGDDNADFTVLFNGRDLSGWNAKPGSWVARDGELTRGKGGGYVWSDERFGDFELELEYKISEGGNSGIFLRTSDTKDPVQTGIEFQVFDSYGKSPDKHACGAIYDCLAPSTTADRKAGEWNHVAITCRGPRITAELNGQPIIDMNLDDWTEAHKNPDGTPNKFNTAYKDMPRSGHIGFQDHGNPVWYRNIRIRRLGDGRE